MNVHDVSVRVARPDDTDTIVAIVNDAYRVEAFFVAGDRVGVSEIERLIADREVLVAEDEHGVVGCVHAAVANGRGYFGMLAVQPRTQGRGIGRTLIAAAESHAASHGCRFMDIKVVSVRTDLLPFYERLGYAATGAEPYEHRPLLQPCHFVLMTKSL